MVSRILKGAAITFATTALASAAHAGCGSSLYCSSAHGTMPALGSWSSTSGSSYDMGGAAYSSAGTTSSYSYDSSYGGVMSGTQADATYGTGSISSTYTGGDVDMYGFSGALSSAPGLGYGESLQATNCAANVYNPEGGRVLGCYNVVKSVPQTNYVRVVRPVVYVRYPVPTPVPYTVNVPSYSACGGPVITHTSRYGGRSFNQGLGYGYGYRGGCR